MSAFDVLVCVVGWDCGRVDPALCFGGVELKAKACDIYGDDVQCVFDVCVVGDDVDVVHVGGCGRIFGTGVGELCVGFGKRRVEGEGECQRSQGAPHGNSAVCGVGLCCVVNTALVGGLSGDPWSEEWFVLGVVLLDGLYDGAVVEVGKCCLYVDGEDGVVGVVV